ncbi:DUF2868 domain-containing protein [Moraxella cuniculi]|uniref:Uncharacterized membrane protein NMB1645 n=1 Tax=Moraxella cuniculi TaxID=34061 RepID=A0A3S4UUZ5_9GAMM|nr:DUF2868 domain-containing protein [Moraxella cuniculi]VEG13613.1 Uncharacterized membrane protein NMB1645 [Moraxella cuniculi]
MDKYTELEHQHLQAIKLLEEQDYIFAQNPKIITKAVASEAVSSYDKLFLRAKKIDSDGQIMQQLIDATHTVALSKRLLYLAYFLLGLFGVVGLLSGQSLNFFYVIIALLGWHSLSLLIWLVQLTLPHRPSLIANLINKFILKNNFIYGNKSNKPRQIISAIVAQSSTGGYHAVLHGAWLCGLIGSMLGLLGLFLFKSYQFYWQSTLLPDGYFYQLIAIIGYLPAKLGLTLPTATNNSPDDFAWLMIASLLLYGILPRLLAYLFSIFYKNNQFKIDTKDSYYVNLLNFYNQQIIDKDDYQPVKPIIGKIHAISDTLILASLEKATNIQPNHEFIADFGVVDSQQQIQELLAQAESLAAQIYLIVNSDTPPDRGIIRKVEQLSKHPFGMIVALSGTHRTHDDAWQLALNQRQIATEGGSLGKN